MTEEELSKLEREGCGNCGILVAEIRRLTSGQRVWGRFSGGVFCGSKKKVAELDIEYHLVPVEPGDEE